MPRLVIISNRLPVTIKKEKNELIYHPSAGGLATGLNSLDNSIAKIWIGWPGQPIKKEEEKEAVRNDLAEDGLIPVFLNQKDVELYYEGFSNKVIWPHFHYFTQYTTYNDHYWEAYQKVNREFAKEVIQHLQEDDFVWVHDYQLMLLPAMIREAFPTVSIGFFLHIPFPSYEIFRILPWRDEILQGLLGADQIGFHTFDYMRHFLSAAYRIMGYEHSFGKLTVDNRIVNVDVFPMGIDYDKYAHPENYSEEKATSKDADMIRKLASNRRIILSIDRLDYTKGIPQRIHAFAQFLKKHPEYHRKVALVMLVVPSRSNVDQYQELKQEVDTLVGHINGQYGTFDWTPVKYFYRSLRFPELTTLYKEADIALITPLRDGMNLVAKEFVASKEDSKKGVLILSEMTGASIELAEALSVNPQDANDIVNALVTALEMPEEEQRQRLETMQEKLKKYNVRHWANTFIKEQIKLVESQRSTHTNLLNGKEKNALLDQYRTARKRLLVLDYDGTLMDFKRNPQAVVPDGKLLELLRAIRDTEGNTLVISSGRDRETLEKFLGMLQTDLAAEHGVWRKTNGEWGHVPGITGVWKPEIRTILENLVERTPGSFIEEKEYSIAWHYRGIDKDLGEKRIREFRDMLVYLTANLDLQVLEGNKVVEIKNSGVNKGKAVAHWVEAEQYDFILTIGDDHTDEDTFRAMPEGAYTIKVGMAKTAAKYNLLSVSDVRELLGELAAIGAIVNS